MAELKKQLLAEQITVQKLLAEQMTVKKEADDIVKKNEDEAVERDASKILEIWTLTSSLRAHQDQLTAADAKNKGLKRELETVVSRLKVKQELN